MVSNLVFSKKSACVLAQNVTVVGGVLVHHAYWLSSASFVVRSCEAARRMRPNSRANRSVELEPGIVMAYCEPRHTHVDEVAVGQRDGGRLAGAVNGSTRIRHVASAHPGNPLSLTRIRASKVSKMHPSKLDQPLRTTVTEKSVKQIRSGNLRCPNPISSEKKGD